MPQRNWISKLHGSRLPQKIGNKAANLWRLQHLQYRIPETRVITWDAYQAYLESGNAAREMLRPMLNALLNEEKTYAVRSSANVEDSPAHSFAGLFKTVLNVRTTEEILGAILQVWESAQSEAVTSYLQQNNSHGVTPQMAVILQEMVDPVVSGVAFSRNPVTLLEEVVIEAVEGPGTQLVQDGVTPFRWVNKWDNWIEKPQDTPLPSAVLEQICEESRRIAMATRQDVDLEWVYDGQQLYWLQMRRITALDGENIYSNKISREMMPGLIHPLVWSVNVPITAGVWIDLFAEILGRRVAAPHDLVKSFHYHSYFNVGVFGRIFDELGMPQETLEIMQGIAPRGAGKPRYRPGAKMLLRLPRLFAFLVNKWTIGKKLEKEYQGLIEETRRFSTQADPDLSAQKLLEAIDRIASLNRNASYNLVHAMLLMQVYNQVLALLLKSAGVDFQQINLTESMHELESFDPGPHLAALNRKMEELPMEIQDRIRSGEYEIIKQRPEARAFLQGFSAFLDAFGHMSDATSNFGKTPWRETPGLILQMIAAYQPPEIGKPKVSFTSLERKGIKGWATGLFYRRARQFHLLREQASSIYTHTLMLFRAYYLALGEQLVNNGVLQNRLDIFFLYDEEIRSHFNGDREDSRFFSLVAQRKQEMAQAEHIILPEIVFGENHPPVVLSIGEKLTGTPTSRGYYTGKTRVIRGINDFQRLQNGDVLVIPYSDVSWLPLFARAGAVVAESGGMLSHSSIIAREYGIPAVVSVNGALGLEDETLVSIDGYKGEIIIHGNHLEKGEM